MDDKTIQLITIDDSFDTEEEITSKLRDAGYAAKSTRVEDEEDLTEALASNAPGIVLYFDHMELITLKQTVACLNNNENAANTRVIAINKNELPDTKAGMLSGAVDTASFADIDHLILIIIREFKSYTNANQVSQLKKEFEESEKRCTSLLDSSRDAIAYVHEGMHVYSNQSYLDMFGITESDDLEGIPILDMVATEGRDEFKKFLREYTKNTSGIEKLKTNLHKPNGDEFDGEMELSSARIEGEPCVQIIIRQEEVNSEEFERQLKQIHQHDQLTGLYNRQYCIEKLEETIKDAEQNHYTAALMEIHIDNFNDVKNNVGVVQSDKYIIEAAKTLKNSIRDSDTISRYTHDSFIVLAVNTDNETIETYAAELQNAIAQLETNIEQTVVNTTCSIGIALIDSDSPEYNQVLARSEKAITSAQEKGTNQIVTHIPEEGELSRHEIDAKFKEQLTSALKDDKFVLHYQPIISLHGDTAERYEVFVRLQDEEDDKLIMPQDFLPAAERIGMSIAVDRWVLFKAIKEYLRRAEEGKNTRFFIKLSDSSIKDETLVDWLTNQVKEKKIPANTLNFEIKEATAITNLKSTKSLSQKFKAMGCNFILDDFGTGSNPFRLLEHVDVDYIRLDRELMNDLAENTQNQETIQRLTGKATELGKFTIAQHVPDANSLSILWGMGINFIQGYFLQEPLAKMEYDFTEISG